MKYIIIIFVLLFAGCSEDYISQANNNEILKNKPTCMKLMVFPPNKTIEDKLNSLYTFDDECKLELIVSYKGSIVCNSNQNSQKKALGMAKSYLRFELKKQNNLFYSYYIDLDNNFEASDVENGFDRMKDTLDLD